MINLAIDVWKTNHGALCSNFFRHSSCFNMCLILIGGRIRMNFESVCKWLQLSWTSLFIITQQAIWLTITQPTCWNATIVTIAVIFIFTTEIWKKKFVIFLENPGKPKQCLEIFPSILEKFSNHSSVFLKSTFCFRVDYWGVRLDFFFDWTDIRDVTIF